MAEINKAIKAAITEEVEGKVSGAKLEFNSLGGTCKIEVSFPGIDDEFDFDFDELLPKDKEPRRHMLEHIKQRCEEELTDLDCR